MKESIASFEAETSSGLRWWVAPGAVSRMMECPAGSNREGWCLVFIGEQTEGYFVRGTLKQISDIVAETHIRMQRR